MGTQHRMVSLEADSLGRLEQGLRALAAELSSPLPTRVVTMTAQATKTEVERNLAGLKLDGNDPGSVSVELNGQRALVVNEGPQVKYLEFGTGATGAASPHPQASTSGWAYGSRIMWVYFNKLTGRFATSKGLPAQAHMLRAGRAAHRIITLVASGEIRKVLSRL